MLSLPLRMLNFMAQIPSTDPARRLRSTRSKVPPACEASTRVANFEQASRIVSAVSSMCEKVCISIDVRITLLLAACRANIKSLTNMACSHCKDELNLSPYSHNEV